MAAIQHPQLHPQVPQSPTAGTLASPADQARPLLLPSLQPVPLQQPPQRGTVPQVGEVGPQQPPSHHCPLPHLWFVPAVVDVGMQARVEAGREAGVSLPPEEADWGRSWRGEGVMRESARGADDRSDQAITQARGLTKHRAETS